MTPARAGAWLLRAAAAALLAALSACGPAVSPQAPRRPPPAPDEQAATPRVSGTIPSNANRQSVFESRGIPPAATPAARGASSPNGEGGAVTLNFVDTDIREIVRVILGTTLKLNYTIDPGVQGTASLDLSKPMPRAQLLATLETLLNQNGATLIERNGVFRVAPLATGVITGSATFGAGTQVVPLKYVSAKELARVLEPYVTEGGKIAADEARNALLVSGDAAVREVLIDLIHSFDIDVLARQSYAILPAGENTPEKLAGELQKVFQSETNGPLAGVVRIIALPRVNAVLVVSPQPRYLDEARRFLGLEERAVNATARAWHVYYVQNGQSSDLENLLQRAFTPDHVTPVAAGPGSTAPNAEPLRVNSSFGAPGGGPGGPSGLQQGGGPGSGFGANGANPPAGMREGAANPATEPLSAVGEGEGRREAADHVRIIADRHNNSLLIYATPSEYAVMQGMIRKIDIIPLQVLIEATIAEVTLNDELNYGTQFFLGQKFGGMLNFGGVIPASTSTTGTTTTSGLPAGAVATIAGQTVGYANNFPGFVLANGVREVINALSAVTKVRVLSAPQVMVLDNQPARLQVGSLVPVQIQSQQSTLTSNAPIVNSIDYRDTGIIMVVTPRVNSGGLVTLDVSQEVSDVASLTTGNINSPTFDQRLIRTRVAVQDGQTVGMAGLIRDVDSQGNQGIPFLKDIPVLGSLLSSQSNSRTRTELLVLITPHVVRDQHDARSLTQDLRKQLTNADQMPEALGRQPLSGSPNPNRLP